ncbi:MAG TPA: HmuY family protein [Bacteroidia bacterium]|nr:HmuY family protein [Bacteroidia bacterium]
MKQATTYPSVAVSLNTDKRFAALRRLFRSASFCTSLMLLIIVPALFLTSCQKEDTPMTLPPPGDLETMVAAMGNSYDNQVYVDLSTGSQVTVPYKSFDLAFEAAPNGWRIYLNTAKYMFVANTGAITFSAADTTGAAWKTETDNLYDDSTAIGDWRSASSTAGAEVYVLDRGRTEHFGTDRWRKFQVLSCDSFSYTFRFCNMNNTGVTDYTITKDPNYSLMYFSFNSGGLAVQVAPPKNSWDLVFTKYTHTYYDEPPDSPYRYYMVSGALLNRWSDARNAIMKKDSTIGYKPFEEVKAADMINYTFYKEAAIIGFEWKTYDFNLGYLIIPDLYYLLLDHEGYYYKIRFYDFYDSQGNKGAASFEYQRL